MSVFGVCLVTCYICVLQRTLY